ncbi:MAG: cytochrome c biogenesis protein CcdA [Candidatus Brockarchaeota archaeon]|nr:cytochrome c biogenesis protein CcdA [Candidatus Brockarchaeota archaeon]
MALDLLGLTFAFTAGIFSLISPCGYALLPGYISYYLGSKLPVGKAVSGGLVCTAGLMTLFSVIGMLASSLGALLAQIIPLFDLVAGTIVMFMGVSMLIKIRIPYISMPTKISKRGGLFGLYIFGIIYGLAAAGCSTPIFLSILFYAMAKGIINGTVMFITYAIGMGLPLIVTNVLVAEAKELMIKKIVNSTLWLQRISGILLIVVGIYLFYFYYSTYVV